MKDAKDRPIKQPSPEHPISIEPSSDPVTVTVAGRVVARSERALILQEASYPAVPYIPPEDVDFELLEATDHTSYCPFKGEANYYSLPVGGERSENAVWQYSSPHPAMSEIEGHVAFYPDRVDSID
jgi:uncharacterized protein (DUF427 family)